QPIGVHEDYSRPPHWLPNHDRIKLARAELKYADARKPEPYPEDRSRDMERAYSRSQWAKRAFEEARAKHAHARDVLEVRLRLLENYFNKFAMDRLPFAVVDDAVCTYHGSAGQSLMDYLA